MKYRFLNIGKILLSIVMLPLWFVDIFKGVGHLPNQNTGEIIEVVFWHSMFDNTFHPILAYISMTVSIASLVLNAVALKYPKIQKVSNTVFGFGFVIFLVLFLLASSVCRGY